VGHRAFPVLLNALDDTRKEVRVGAIAALGSHRDRRAITVLTKALANADFEARRHAEKALEKIDPEWKNTREASAAFAALFEALSDPKRDRAAALILSKFGAAAIPGLVEKLGDSDDRVRREAVFTMKMMREAASDAVPSLIDALKREKNSFAFDELLECLSTIRDKRAIDIIKLISTDHNDSSTRYKAKQALRGFGIGPRSLSDLQGVEKDIAMALKRWYRESARTWWQSSGKQSGICDDGNEDLQHGEGYLRPGEYLCCERCTDSLLIQTDWERAIQDLNAYFGPGLPQGHRTSSCTGGKDLCHEVIVPAGCAALDTQAGVLRPLLGHQVHR
jgi:HEAT repeat protein